MKVLVRRGIWPLSSALFGILDLKTAATVVALFAFFNKVAGLYGLLASVAGAGGSAAQLSLYVYSVTGLFALAWGLRAVVDEHPEHTRLFAHFFAADHLLSTAWTAFFAIVWWVWTPHDGRRQANSPAQQQIKDDADVSLNLTTVERKLAAIAIWNHEKTTAAAIIVCAWLIKIYFAALLYSYTFHLRKRPYRRINAPPYNAPDDDDEETASNAIPPDAYRLPPARSRTHTHASSSITAGFANAPGRRGSRPELIFDSHEAPVQTADEGRIEDKRVSETPANGRVDDV